MSSVFKALADPTRRLLLDRLHERNGQTLSELCVGLGMARQSASQHVELLEAANLVSSVRRGRHKLHYLNPIPLHAIEERWIDKFERPRLRALSAVKQRAEEFAMTERPTYVYTTYIHSTPENVWQAITDADVSGAYWGHRNISDWKPGSRWEHQRNDGSEIADVVGTVIEAVAPERLVMTWSGPSGEENASSQVTFAIEPYHEIVRLTVTHQNLADQAEYEAAAAGWPAVLANLKSLLETGQALPQAPWEMHAELRAARTAINDPR
ncbi:MAG: ArsR/SmtB family transcription factor [Gaiellaceae bacterium]